MVMENLDNEQGTDTPYLPIHKNWMVWTKKNLVADFGAKRCS